MKTIPSQRKKMEAILRCVAKAFQPGDRYTEREVNEILENYHQDIATLRRELIGASLLERSAGGREYWRVVEQS